MDNIINENNEVLNAHFQITTIDNELGLTLESRGGTERNNDYNVALEVVLNRLQRAAINGVTIKVVSTTLLKHYSDPFDRTIKIGNHSAIDLRDRDLHELRKQIGSAVAKLKVNPTTKGGNQTKRIQLVAKQLNEKEWKKIALGIWNEKEEKTPVDLFDHDQFNKEVDEYLKKPIKDEPEGKSKPRKKISTPQEVYERDPKVKAWVLQNSKGCCECCKNNSPFIASNGMPFLEVHHLKTLATGGSDKTSNTVALCPNCHRELHFGIDKEKLTLQMYNQIKRLKKEG
jgi:5-methylcytosine-specific restriction protein A